MALTCFSCLGSLDQLPNHHAIKRIVKLGPLVQRDFDDNCEKDELPTTPINITHSTKGPQVLDEQNPVVKVIVKGKEVLKSIIDGGSGVNVITKATCDRLGIQQWEVCPF